MKDKMMLQKILGVFAVIFIVGLIFVGYRFEWTGFTDRTLWDWMELIIIPVLLFLIARYFVESADKREKSRQESQQKIEQERLLEDEQSKILQDYFDRMQTLILDKDLYKAEETSHVSILARSITLLTLKRLRPEHKGTVIMFLDTSGLIHPSPNGRVISLSSAKLQGLGSPIGIAEMNLQGIDLRAANLSGAKLDVPDFKGADLMLAILDNASLIGADLRGANLSGASLENCNLCWAIFDESTTLPNGNNWTGTTKITDWGAIEIPPFTDEELEQTRREFRMDIDNIEVSAGASEIQPETISNKTKQATKNK